MKIFNKDIEILGDDEGYIIFKRTKVLIHAWKQSN